MEERYITQDEWIRLSNDAGLHSRICRDPYIVAYQILSQHFSSLKEINWNTAVIGLHIVYGWMPTIPDLGSIMSWDEEKRQRVCSILYNVSQGYNPKIDEAELLKFFCNNSIVGASKLMHFLCPNQQPIWDSRVAKTFYRKSVVHNYQVNSIKSWDAYARTLRHWETFNDVKDHCDVIRSLSPALRNISDIRAIELVLFQTQVLPEPLV